MATLIFYIILCVTSSLMVGLVQNFSIKHKLLIQNKKVDQGTSFLVYVMVILLPLFLVYGFRYGVGTDYFSYRNIYEKLHGTPFSEYIVFHFLNVGSYYVEVSYYFLNRICGSFEILNFVLGILLYFCVFLTLKEYVKRMNLALSIFIYMSTQFIYSMNGVRFAIALVIVLFSFQYIRDAKPIKYILCILIATTFHKTALFCLIMYFMREYKSSNKNRLRNYILGIGMVVVPFALLIVQNILRKIILFERYFGSQIYAAKSMHLSLTWLLHIVPVLLPIIIVCKDKIKATAEIKILFRISLLEIPLRTLALYNEVYLRLSRLAQISQVLLIPLILSQVKNRKNKKILICYYIIWYTFYFCYYAVMIGQEGALNYSFSFMHH